MTLLVLIAVLLAKDQPADVAAKLAFARVESASLPREVDLFQCSVTQIEVMKKGRSQRAAAIPRDAYCRFLLALRTGDEKALQQAPAAFRAARGDGNNRMAPLLDVLALVSEFHLHHGNAAALGGALALVSCSRVEFVSGASCRSVLEAAKQWSGAARPVDSWRQAMEAFQDGEWEQASSLLESLLGAGGKMPGTLTELLSPRRETPGIEGKLALAWFLQGKTDRALPMLDRAIARDPRDASSLFLRARIREDLGLRAPAMADLEAAAMAGAAPFHQAVLLLRQGHAHEAAVQFSSLPESTRDREAWRLLAEGCAAGPGPLERAAAGASPLFPRREAFLLAGECALRASTTLPQLLAAETELLAAGALDRNRVSNLYLKFGLDAEDHHDPAAADAYRHALAWSPTNTKARFNLAALYIEDRDYARAEGEYRSLMNADPADREAQYWLARTILAGEAGIARKAEACELLKQAMQIADAAKRQEFAAAAVVCTP